MVSVVACVLGFLQPVCSEAQSHDSFREKTKLLWADRREVLFLTILLPRTGWFEPNVTLAASGEIVLASASGDAMLNVTLSNEIDPRRCTWRNRKSPWPRVELTLAKAAPGRWSELLSSSFSGVVETDWKKYQSIDDELDERERISGVRGKPVQGAPQLAKAVDDYFLHQRRQRLEKNESPSLDAIMKEAEREMTRTQGDFNEIVQRLWAAAKMDQTTLREREIAEDAWASEGEAERYGTQRRKKRRRVAPQTEL